MVAGLPGTGIGGLFYLVLALLMPVWELGWALVGRSNAARWRLAFRQSAMALLVLGAIWLTGLALTLAGIGPAAHQVNGALRTLYVAPALVAFGTLAAVLAAVEAASLAFAIGARVSQLRSSGAAASGGDR